MRHFVHTRVFAAPAPVAALALGVTVPAASRVLIPASRRAQRFTPSGAAATCSAIALASVAARADEHLAPASGTQKQSGIVHRSPRRGGLDDPRSPGNTALGAVRQCGSGRSLGRDRQVNVVRGCAGLPDHCDLTPTAERRHRTGAPRRHLLVGNIGSGRRQRQAPGRGTGTTQSSSAPIPQSRFTRAVRRITALSQSRLQGQKGRFEIHVFHGSFEDHLDKIASVCRDGFTFTFIDPTGWNIRSEPVLEFLRGQKGEFLINFMAEHVNRHAEYSKVAASFGRFLADPDWEGDFNALPQDWSNEERVMYLLKRKVKETRAATYLPDFPILKPREDRVKMRLMLGTHSPKGLEVFRDVQAKVERTEIETRNRLRDSSNHQVGLFSDDEIATIHQEAAGIGCLRYQREAEALVREFLSGRRAAPFGAIATEILEATPIRLTQLRRLVDAMKRRGLVAFDLPPRKRVPRSETRISLAGPGFRAR